MCAALPLQMKIRQMTLKAIAMSSNEPKVTATTIKYNNNKTCVHVYYVHEKFHSAKFSRFLVCLGRHHLFIEPQNLCSHFLECSGYMEPLRLS